MLSTNTIAPRDSSQIILSQNTSIKAQQQTSQGNYLEHNQSKHLLEINDRLTKQIENNLALFENLNNELTNKDKTIAEN